MIYRLSVACIAVARSNHWHFKRGNRLSDVWPSSPLAAEYGNPVVWNSYACMAGESGCYAKRHDIILPKTGKSINNILLLWVDCNRCS